jgi:hypothetical protein
MADKQVNELLAAADLSDRAGRITLADTLREAGRTDEANLLAGEKAICLIDGKVCAMRRWKVGLITEEPMEADIPIIEAPDARRAMELARKLARTILWRSLNDDYYLNYGHVKDTPDDKTRCIEAPLEIETEASVRITSVDDSYRERIAVRAELDHDDLISHIDGDPDCEHEWSYEATVVLGATGADRKRCLTCGLQQLIWETEPYSVDRTKLWVRYRQPCHWCANCQSEDPCDCREEDDDFDEDNEEWEEEELDGEAVDDEDDDFEGDEAP